MIAATVARKNSRPVKSPSVKTTSTKPRNVDALAANKTALISRSRPHCDVPAPISDNGSRARKSQSHNRGTLGRMVFSLA
jgi:hypothetical protein